MKNRWTVAKYASVVAPMVAVSVFGGCHNADSHHVLNPDNVIPPGPSPVIEETRPLSGVSGVILDGVGQVFIRQGGAETLRIRTEERILPFIRTRMQGGRLLLGFAEGTSYHGQASAIEFHVTLVELESAELSGAGGISASNIDTDRLSVVHTGAGGVELSGLAATRLEVERSGVGNISVSGSVQQQSIALGGLGHYEARNLASARADVTILTSGSATVRVSDRLDARIDGSGSVYYLGDPVVQRTGGGAGSVEPL